MSNTAQPDVVDNTTALSAAQKADPEFVKAVFSVGEAGVPNTSNPALRGAASDNEQVKAANAGADRPTKQQSDSGESVNTSESS